MCGIIGYVGSSRQAQDVLILGLKKLEYRGYDSAGIAIAEGDAVALRKAVTSKDHNLFAIEQLSRDGQTQPLLGGCGIGHTRWATHGAPSERNAHPHADCAGEVFVVHNGTVENYTELKSELETKGHTQFRSETDTEIIAHLIEEEMKQLPFEQAVCAAIARLHGTFGIVVMHRRMPGTLIAANMASALLIGYGDGEMFIASDTGAIRTYTDRVTDLEDGQLAIVTASGVQFKTFNAKPVMKEIRVVEESVEDLERGNHAHIMLKEILEQPRALRDVLRGRLDYQHTEAKLGGQTHELAFELVRKNRVHLVGCGTAYYAAAIGAMALREFAGYDAQAVLASEFPYGYHRLNAEHDFLVAVSQSGETLDTRIAIEEAKRHGLKTLGVVNVVGSQIARKSDAGVYIHAGPERAIASTKAFLGQVTALMVLALFLGRKGRGLAQAPAEQLMDALSALPEQVEQILAAREHIASIARIYAEKKPHSMLFLGRGYDAWTAAEGALKVKEITYIHAESYAAGEMKHGPIALLTDGYPVVVIANRGPHLKRMYSTIEECRARGAEVIVFGDGSDTELTRLAKYVIPVPTTIEALTPILTATALHLFAYELAVGLSREIDKPRNLAKSVTVG